MEGMLRQSLYELNCVIASPSTPAPDIMLTDQAYLAHDLELQHHIFGDPNIRDPTLSEGVTEEESAKNLCPIAPIRKKIKISRNDIWKLDFQFFPVPNIVRSSETPIFWNTSGKHLRNLLQKSFGFLSETLLETHMEALRILSPYTLAITLSLSHTHHKLHQLFKMKEEDPNWLMGF
ncbi:hypothetical protein BDR07DRAFT_1477503 [Suillus spraguei]|nr:hypothetical protein BDR07DRAFT_1477503 [Suillus spraguei]